MAVFSTQIISDEEKQLQYQLTEIDEKKDDNPCFVEAALQLLEVCLKPLCNKPNGTAVYTVVRREKEPCPQVNMLAIKWIIQLEVVFSCDGFIEGSAGLTTHLLLTDIGGDSVEKIEPTHQQNSPPWAGASSAQFQVDFVFVGSGVLSIVVIELLITWQQVGEYEAAFSDSEEEDNGEVISQDSGPTTGEGELGGAQDEGSSFVEAESASVDLVEMDSWAKDVKPLEGAFPPSHTYYFYQCESDVCSLTKE